MIVWAPRGFDTFVGLDHPLANIESEVCCAVEDNVHDGLEGVRRQPLRRRNEIARGVVDHHVGEAWWWWALLNRLYLLKRVLTLTKMYRDGQSVKALFRVYKNKSLT